MENKGQKTMEIKLVKKKKKENVMESEHENTRNVRRKFVNILHKIEKIKE